MVKITLVVAAILALTGCAATVTQSTRAPSAPGSAMAADKAAKANGLTIQNGRAVYP